MDYDRTQWRREILPVTRAYRFRLAACKLEIAAKRAHADGETGAERQLIAWRDELYRCADALLNLRDD